MTNAVLVVTTILVCRGDLDYGLWTGVLFVLLCAFAFYFTDYNLDLRIWSLHPATQVRVQGQHSSFSAISTRQRTEVAFLFRFRIPSVVAKVLSLHTRKQRIIHDGI